MNLKLLSVILLTQTWKYCWYFIIQLMHCACVRAYIHKHTYYPDCWKLQHIHTHTHLINMHKTQALSLKQYWSFLNKNWWCLCFCTFLCVRKLLGEWKRIIKVGYRPTQNQPRLHALENNKEFRSTMKREAPFSGKWEKIPD